MTFPIDTERAMRRQRECRVRQEEVSRELDRIDRRLTTDRAAGRTQVEDDRKQFEVLVREYDALDDEVSRLAVDVVKTLRARAISDHAEGATPGALRAALRAAVECIANGAEPVAGITHVQKILDGR